MALLPITAVPEVLSWEDTDIMVSRWSSALQRPKTASTVTQEGWCPLSVGTWWQHLLCLGCRKASFHHRGRASLGGTILSSLRRVPVMSSKMPVSSDSQQWRLEYWTQLCRGSCLCANVVSSMSDDGLRTSFLSCFLSLSLFFSLSVFVILNRNHSSFSVVLLRDKHCSLLKLPCEY